MNLKKLDESIYSLKKSITEANNVSANGIGLALAKKLGMEFLNAEFEEFNDNIHIQFSVMSDYGNTHEITLEISNILEKPEVIFGLESFDKDYEKIRDGDFKDFKSLRTGIFRSEP